MSFLRLLLCTLCCFWITALHALPDDPHELFKIMMGQTGVWDWMGWSQEQLWSHPFVQQNVEKPFDHYTKAIQCLKKRSVHSIPKSIHFIWIGPKPFPEQSISNLISWKKHHPNWNFYFWTDDPDRPIPVEGMQRQLVSDFDFGQFQPLIEEMTNWGGKSDLMRYMILYKMGGIYTDHDVRCIQPFDPLITHYDFAVGYEPLHNYSLSLSTPFVPNNGIIISCPHHLILEKTIEQVCARWNEIGARFPGGDIQSEHQKFYWRTFDTFAYCAYHLIDDGNYQNILLPACYLQSGWFFDKQTFHELTEQGHVYAIHLFNASWATVKRTTSKSQQILQRKRHILGSRPFQKPSAFLTTSTLRCKKNRALNR